MANGIFDTQDEARQDNAERAGDLAGLIENLKASTGPDRYLDRLIGEAAGAPIGSAGDVVGLGYARFTASLDAAMTLVPEGWFWRAGMFDFGGPSAQMAKVGATIDAQGKTPAIALCIAALRARSPEQ